MAGVSAPVFSDEEVGLALGRNPGLFRTGPGSVEGELIVHAVYDGVEIKDRFQVRITCQNPLSKRVPALFEIGGRTNAIMAKWSIEDASDLHRNPEGSACVCVRQEERERFPAGADLAHFIEGLCRDYLYGLAFFEMHGHWPWGERSHGALGILEFYADTEIISSKEAIEEILPNLTAGNNWREFHRQVRRPSGRKACLCGSRRAFEVCHPVAWRGLSRLAIEMDRFGMSRRGTLDRARAKLKGRY